MSNTRAGHDFEREIGRIFRQAGFDVTRAAGSKGRLAGLDVDLVVSKVTDATKYEIGVALLQCKRSKR